MFWKQPRLITNMKSSQGGFSFSLTEVVLLLLLIACAATFYFYTQGDIALFASNEAQAEQVIADVGELIILPAVEMPTIATVTDPKLLSGQPFFAHAETGDKVLVYPEAKKAILYRPSVHKIVEVMPFELPQEINEQ